MQRCTRDPLAPSPQPLAPGTLLAALTVIVMLLSPLPVLSQQQQTDYVVGPQDVLAITVWDQPDLNNKFTVEADGTVTFPMIGRVQAGGLTLRQVEAELR